MGARCARTAGRGPLLTISNNKLLGQCIIPSCCAVIHFRICFIFIIILIVSFLFDINIFVFILLTERWPILTADTNLPGGGLLGARRAASGEPAAARDSSPSFPAGPEPYIFINALDPPISLHTNIDIFYLADRPNAEID